MNKPKWEDVDKDPEWEWVADAPGRIVKVTATGTPLACEDDETNATCAWRQGVEAQYGADNVMAGRARHPGPNTMFALYRRIAP